MQHFSFPSLADVDGSPLVHSLEIATDRQAKFQQVVVDMLREHIHLSMEHSESSDGVLAYADEVLSLTLLLAEFEDAIKEGDGGRVIRCWKFLLPIFRVTHHKNYSLGALNLLIQYNALLSPRHREQLLWSRFINTSGKPGENKACDLHMEHLNRMVKVAIGGLGSNVTPNAIMRIGKCAGPLMNVCSQFDAISDVIQGSGKHGGASWAQDVKKIAEQLKQAQVFQSLPGRQHPSFPKVKQNIASKMNMETFRKWFKSHSVNLSV